MTTDEQGSEMYAALIGEKRRDYYLKRFESFDDRGGGFIPSWNWAAFIFGTLWALYRKMYAVFFLVIGIGIVWGIIDAALSLGSPLYDLIYLVLWFGFGIYGNALYYQHTIRKIEKARTTLPDAEKVLSYVQSKGGVHVWVIWVPLLIPIAGILAAIVIPPYQDYTIRAQVSMGLNLSGGAKAAVTGYYLDSGAWPPNNVEAGLPIPADIVGEYVVSVGAVVNVITITYGNDAHATITGQTITMTATDDDGRVSWACASTTIANKHLPAACRT